MSEPLFVGLFDDAAMFPPATLPVDKAMTAHARHRLSWYEDFVGPLVCIDARLIAVDEHAARLGLDVVDVAVVVPDGVAAVQQALATVDRCERLSLRAVEAPLGSLAMRAAVTASSAVAERGGQMYVEIPVRQVTERHIHELCVSGLFLKLRTGGTTVDAFHTEDELARPIVLCAAELLRFKCTAGLHNAVRHRDEETGFEHHGFLNIALAALAAAGTGSVSAVRDILAERDPNTIAARTRGLGAPGIAAIRSLFGSFGTCSVTEPLHDLITMGLVSAG